VLQLPFDEKRMSFTEHLGELRTRIIRVAIMLFASFIVGWGVSGYLFELLSGPIDSGIQRYVIEHPEALGVAPPSTETGSETGTATAAPATEETKTGPRNYFWTTLTPMEAFIVYIRLAFYFSLVVSFPFILYQVCAFVFPGLHVTERRIVQVLIYGCSVLAVFGTVVAYVGILPFVMPYMIQYAPAGVLTQLQMAPTINLILVILAGFAVAFQFPMAVLILVHLGILTPKSLRSYRRLAIVAIAFVSAIFTPPEPLSMMVMMAPMVILYEISILVSYLVVWRRAKKDQSTAVTPL